MIGFFDTVPDMKVSMLCVFFSLAMSIKAFCFSGAIETPQLPYPKHFDPNSKEEILKAHEFMRTHIHLVEGWFHGSRSTSQRFSASSKNTARMVTLIQNLGLWNLTIEFHDFQNQKIAFSMITNWENNMRIVVNTGMKSFLIHDFDAFLPTRKHDH